MKTEPFLPIKKAFEVVRARFPDLSENAVHAEIRRDTDREKKGEKLMLPHRRSSPVKKARITIKVSTLMGYAETLYRN